jgi:hypothetical protein
MRSGQDRIEVLRGGDRKGGAKDRIREE